MTEYEPVGVDANSLFPPRVESRLAATIAAATLMASTLVINVAENGITGTGSDQESVLAQALLTDNPGKCIFFPGSHYDFNTLYVSTGTWLAGGGQGATTLKAKNAIGGHFLRTVTGSADITISDMTIDGNKANQASAGTGTAPANGGIYVLASSRTTLSRLRVLNAEGHGIHFSLTGTDYGQRVSDVVIENCGSDELNTYGSAFATTNANGMTLSNVHALNCAKAGFRLSGTGFTLTNCIATGNSNGGLVGVSGELVGLTVNGGHFSYNGPNGNNDGIRLVGCKNVILNGPTCAGNYGSGIGIFNSSSNIQINDPICYNNGRSAEALGTVEGRDGITIKGDTSAASDITISARCYDDQTTKTQQYGVRIRGLADFITLKPSNLRGNLVSGYRNDSSTGDSIIVSKCQGVPLWTINNTPVTSTGPATEGVLRSVTLGAGCLGRKNGLRLKASGTLAGTAGTKVLKFALGGTSYTLLSTLATSVANWHIEAEVWNVSATTQRVIVRAFEGTNVDTMSVNDASVDTTADFTVAVTTTLAGTGDTATIRHFTVEPL